MAYTVIGQDPDNRGTYHTHALTIFLFLSAVSNSQPYKTSMTADVVIKIFQRLWQEALHIWSRDHLSGIKAAQYDYRSHQAFKTNNPVCYVATVCRGHLKLFIAERLFFFYSFKWSAWEIYYRDICPLLISRPSKLKSVLSQTPIRTRSRTRLRDINDRAPRSDSSPESVQSHDTVSTVVPQPQTSVIAWKADSSLDLDEDETSVLLDESVVRSEDGGTADRSSEGGDQEADISESDSEMDPGNESTGQMRLPPDGPSDQGTGGVPSSSREVRPRRIVRHRRQPGWMRSGEWDVG